MILNIFPAYGRAYPDLAQALQSWHRGQDFKIHRGPYLSVRNSDQLLGMGIHRVRFWNGAYVLGESELSTSVVEAAKAQAQAQAQAREWEHLASLLTPAEGDAAEHYLD